MTSEVLRKVPSAEAEQRAHMVVVRSRGFIKHRTRQNDGVADSSGRSSAGRKGRRLHWRPTGEQGGEHEGLRDQAYEEERVTAMIRQSHSNDHWYKSNNTGRYLSGGFVSITSVQLDSAESLRLEWERCETSCEMILDVLRLFDAQF